MTGPARRQLWHCFAAGLRFGTRLRHQDARGRWRELVLTEGEAPALARQALAWLGLGPREGAAQARPLACSQPRQALQAMAGVLRQGGLGLVRLELGSPAQAPPAAWALVIGVELAVRRPGRLPEGGSAVRALLVRDPALPEVWACGHNARLVLDRSGRLVYRSLDGGRWPARLLEALALGPEV